MVVNNGGDAFLQLRTLFNMGAIGALSDSQLLERFAAGRSEPRELAFAALVERHGPFVLRVCRSVRRVEEVVRPQPDLAPDHRDARGRMPQGIECQTRVL
jgi:hypothetical protein